MGVDQAALHRLYMRRALDLARRAAADTDAAAAEVPVGAVVVLDDEIIGQGHNQTISLHDPSAHAEMQAIRAAAAAIGNHRLSGATLYVTLEPCIMCAGAILHARLAKLVYGARDHRFGAAGSALNLLESPFLNHRCQIVAGVEADSCGELLREFFAARRQPYSSE